MLESLGLSLRDVDIERRVGQGVSGQVFRGTIRGTETPAAVKVCDFAEADPDFRLPERFHRECRILSRVHHPLLPMLYGCGESSEGQGYAIMEWVEGQPLHGYRDVFAGEMVRIAHGVASGLQALHRRGFVHRDVSFDNILVEERRYGLRPRLIDLGVAKDLSSTLELTMHGSFLGRLAYAAPEALSGAGAAGIRDARSDVFSLGVLLYEWISGQPPFVGETPADMIRSRRKVLPTPVLSSDRGVADASLGRLVLRMMESDVAARPSIDEVVRELLLLRRVHPAHRTAKAPAAWSSLVTGSAHHGYVLLGASFPALEYPTRLSSLEELAPRPAASGERLGHDPDRPSVESPPPASVAGVFGEVSRSPVASRLFLIVAVLAFLGACAGAAFLLMRL